MSDHARYRRVQRVVVAGLLTTVSLGAGASGALALVRPPRPVPHIICPLSAGRSDDATAIPSVCCPTPPPTCGIGPGQRRIMCPPPPWLVATTAAPVGYCPTLPPICRPVPVRLTTGEAGLLWCPGPHPVYPLSVESTGSPLRRGA